MVAALAPSCVSLSPDAAVKQLHSQLVELGNAETERKTLQEQNERDKAMINGCREQAQQASASLERLRNLANCQDKDDERQLDLLIAASKEKSDKKAEYERISAGLIERNASADLGQIEQEASAYCQRVLGEAAALPNSVALSHAEKVRRWGKAWHELMRRAFEGAAHAPDEARIAMP